MPQCPLLLGYTTHCSKVMFVVLVANRNRQFLYENLKRLRFDAIVFY